MTDLRTAAQQALKALEDLAESAEDECGEPTCNDCKAWRPAWAAITALRAALEQPEQEPVAWRVILPDGYQFVYDERMLRVIDESIHETRQPLYTHPLRRETEQEPVAVFDEQQGSPVLLASAPMLSDGQPLYTHPPRREWRSLSEDELTALGIIHSRYQEESLETGGWFDFARAIEQALKEKNHE
jgi:hypothetical protein